MPNNKQPLVLIIEDEAPIRESLRNFLEDNNFEILEAENGLVGLEIFEQEAPDLILVDLRMPGIDGLEVLATVTESSPDTPIIVVSGAGEINDAVEALRLGAWDYLIKPIADMSVLHHALEKALERASLIRENRKHQERLEEEVAKRTKDLKRANAELQQINARLRRIVETTKDISVFTRLNQFGSRLLEEFGRHMLSTGGSLYLVEKKGLHLVHALDPGHAPNFIPYPLQQGSVLQRALNEGKPLLILDVDRTDGLCKSGWEGYTDGAVLVFPLPDEEENVVGLLSLHSKTHPPFVEQDREIGSILASYSSEALRAARATEALRKSEERLTLALEATNEGIWDWDMKKNVTYFSPRCKELLGIKNGSESEYTIKKWYSFLHPDDHDRVMHAVQGHLEQRIPYSVEYRYPYANGEYGWQNLRGQAFYDKDGKAYRMVGSIKDVTDRKQTEERLRIEHGKLQGVLNVIGEGLYIINRDFVIEYQNRILENTFGNTLGRRCYNAYFLSDKPCEFCPADETIASGQIRQVEADLSDGSSYDISASPFTDEDGNVKVILLLREITEKKIMQAEAIRAGHLASLGELAAGVAHEINNPISGVINYAEILKEVSYEKNVDADIPERIIKEGERIANIVRNLLSFARDQKEDYSSAHIKDILSDTLGLAETRINKDGISFNTDLPSNLPSIKARSQEIQQVFLNILSNARHALNKKFPGLDKDKVIEIKGEVLDHQGEQFVRTVFFDKGIGIPEDLLDKICNPFFSTKPKGEGTGLGLSISHNIIKNHKGRLRFESIEGEYTKVIVDLPIWMTDQNQAADQS